MSIGIQIAKEIALAHIITKGLRANMKKAVLVSRVVVCQEVN